MTDNKFIKQKFQSSIKRGTGEAHLIAQKHPDIDFSPSIIKASLTNFAYDGQSEGSRVLYISELIALSKRQGKIRKAILNGLATERQDTWGLVQLFDLATMYAKQGDTEAKQAIYNRFYKKIINGSDWVGFNAILAIDGLDGLKYVASTIGKSLEKNPDDWQDDMIIEHFQSDNPKVNAMKVLKQASKENKYIKIYLATVERITKGRKERQRPVFNLETVRTRIANNESIPPRLIEALSKNDIRILADELLHEKVKTKIGIYLSIFSRTKFPHDYKTLMRFAKGKANNKDRIVEWAVEGLKFSSNGEIREFALEKIKRTKSSGTYVDLLINNYKKGDAKLLKSLVDKYKNEHSLHSIAGSIIKIYKANNLKECKEPLEAIYDKLTCGICREEIIKLLSDNKVLSKRIKAEIKYDSNEETRQYATKK